MKKIISIIFIFFIYQLNILAGFGIQIGSYSSRPNIPAQLKQLNLPSQIIQEGNAFKLFVGPFNTRAQATQVQSNFNIQGNIVEYGNNTPRGGNQNTQQNQSFAIEILSSRDINSVPRRIVNQAFSSGLQPSFIMDKGLYRLVLGPFSSRNDAQSASARLTNIFGREMFTIEVPASRFNSAIRPRTPTAKELSQSALSIASNDQNEHVGFLEDQRRKSVNKYATQPYGPTSRANDRGRLASPMMQSPINEIESEQPSQGGSGLLLSVATMSSKNYLAVNGKVIEGRFSSGFQLGYKITDNTIIQLAYFQPETKHTTVFLEDSKTSEISSIYSFMSSLELKYRYFLPTHTPIFLASNFGANFVQQKVTSDVPLNFGTSYSYNGWYVQPHLGLGAGYRIGGRLSLGIDYNAYFTLKTITSNVKFYANYEF